MNYQFISKTEIFRGINPAEIESMLKCLQSYTRAYKRGDYIYHCGQHVDAMGLILSGSAHIEQNDIWGNHSIFDNIESGQVFAETYAFSPNEPLMVDVVATKDTEVLFLNTDKVLSTCSSSCYFHNQLIHNLVSVLAFKNLKLVNKINHISFKSIRGRLLSYLSSQAIQQGKYSFEIPFNRQQLADYLCTDRSAMSNELSKMQNEGLISFHKNRFELNYK